jgi:hypothetical protein
VLFKGNSAPERKNMGIRRKLVITWKACMDFITDASIIPMVEIVIATKNMIPRTLKNIKKVMGILRSGLKSNIIEPWIIAMVEPPSSFPTTIEVLDIGATRTSLKNPNSLSHTIDMALKKDVNSTVMPIIPGNIKLRNSLPPPPPKVLKELAIPVPSTNKKRMGWANEPIILGLSLKYLLMSLSHMVYIPISSFFNVSFSPSSAFS